MAEIIVLFIFLFLAVFGVSSLTARLWIFLFRPKNRELTFSVSRLRKDYEEEDFLYAFEKYRWYGKEFADYLILLSDNPPCKRVSAFVNAYENIICCKENELAGVVKKITEDEDERKFCATGKT